MRKTGLIKLLSIVCLYSLAVSAVCSTIEGDDIKVVNQAKSDTPERVVLEGVPKIGYGVGTAVGSVTSFPIALWSCMKFLGEDYSVDYVFCTSGGAFRLLWKQWYVDNVVFVWSDKPGESFHWALEILGYNCEYIAKEEGLDNETNFRNRITESIRKGRPVLAQGVVGPPEWSIITGYDEYGDVLIGWSYFEGNEFEPSGYFRQRDWFSNTHNLIIIGEKQEKLPLTEVYHKTLKLAVKIARTPLARERAAGIAAYKAWADSLLSEEEFPTGQTSVALQHLRSHDEVMNVVAEGRWCAWQFMKQMAKDEPAIAKELLAAASCYEAEYNLIWQGWNLADIGYAPFSEVEAKKFAEPDIRHQIADFILQAGDKDKEATNYLEQALAKIESRK